MWSDRGAASGRTSAARSGLFRAASVAVAVVSLAALSVLVTTPPSGSIVHADDVDVASCDEAAFRAAVDAVQSSGGGTVRFDCSGTIPITAAITITTAVAIDGDGSVVLDAENRSRFFVVQPSASLTLLGLELVNGSVNGVDDDGGAIRNHGTLRVVGSTLTSHETSGNGGAIFNDGNVEITQSTLSSNRAASGGAIQNTATGRVEIESSTLRDNAAAQLFMRGGAIASSGDLSVRSSQFIDNTAGMSWGGAIYLSGSDERPATAHVATTAFTGNEASQGGAIALDNDSSLEMIDSAITANNARNGGAVMMAFSTRAEITSSRLTSNTATNVGGAVHNFSDGQLSFVDSLIDGNSAAVDGGAITAGADGGETRLLRTTVAGNTASQDGGAIWAGRARLTAIASTFATNRAEGDGGAIYDHQSGARAIRATTFVGNSAAGNGGAIVNATSGLHISDSVFATNTANGSGGALYNTGRFTVTGSTFTENRSDGDGGAIWTDNILSTNSIGASTFVANAATNGGAIYTGWTELTDIVAATIVGNTAINHGGGIYTRTGGVASRASIVSHNIAPLAANCFREIRSFTQEDGSVRVEDWTIATGGDNLSNDTTCQFDAATDIENSPAFPVGTLSQNGGPTPTMLPLAAPAVDTADCAATTALDQRGAVRPSTACDRGAVEASSEVLPRLLHVQPNRTALDEGDSISIIAVATGPSGQALAYEFDCDGDGSFEQQGVGSGVSGSGMCTFGDDGSFTVGARVCVRDDPTTCDTGSFAVEVANVAPTITAVGNDGPIAQGASVNIVVTALDPAGANDPLVASADCDGDGSYETIGTTTTVQCGYALQGTYDVPVQVGDGDGGLDESTTTIEVRNDVPQITAVTATRPLNEGQSATIDVEASDAGGELAYEFDCDGDGTYEVGAQPDPSTQCTFGDDGVYTVFVRVTDADGAMAGSRTQVIVDNVAPIITGVVGEPVDEGDPAIFEISMTGDDAAGDADILSYEFDCDNDGRFEVGPQLAGTATCSFDDDGEFTIGLRITDGDGGSATGTATAVVRNLAPIISEIRVADTVDEGAPLSVEVVAIDPAGPDDPLSFEFDCAGDGIFEIGPQASPTTTCVFPDINDPDVTVRVTDDDGGAAQQTALVFVDNVDPIVDTPIVAPTPSSEGQSVAAVAAFTDAGIEDTHTCTVDYGDGSGVQDGVVDGLTCTGPPHVYVDDGVGFVVMVEVTDDNFGVGVNSAPHDVDNAPPSIESLSGPGGDVEVDQAVTMTARVLDAGENDVVTATWDWGDGTTTPAEVITTRATAARLSADLAVEHRYTAPGEYTITLHVEDDDGGSSSETLVIDVRAAPLTTASTTPQPAMPPTTSTAVPSPAPVATPSPTAAPTTESVRPIDIRLPATGASNAQGLVVGALLLVAVGAMLLSARRRTRSEMR